MFGTLLDALMAFDTLLARRLTSEASTTPRYSVQKPLDAAEVRDGVVRPGASGGERLLAKRTQEEGWSSCGGF